MANLKIADFINLDFVLFYAFIGISHKFIHSRKKKDDHLYKAETKEIRKPPLPPRYGGEFRGRKIYGRPAQIDCFTFYRKDRCQSIYRYASGLSDSEFVKMTIP